jgi:hypothetical protein
MAALDVKNCAVGPAEPARSHADAKAAARLKFQLLLKNQLLKKRALGHCPCEPGGQAKK